MRYEIKYTSGYIVVVDDIKHGDGWWLNDENVLVKGGGEDNPNRLEYTRVIAHRPIDGSNPLDGVDFLPIPDVDIMFDPDEVQESLLYAYNRGLSAGSSNGYDDIADIFNNLMKEQLPKFIVCDTEFIVEERVTKYLSWGRTIIKTKTNSQGQVVWLGKYEY